MRLLTVKIENGNGCNTTVGIASGSEVICKLQNLFEYRLQHVEFGMAYYDGVNKVVRMAGNENTLLSTACGSTNEIAIADLFVLVIRREFEKEVLQCIRGLSVIQKIYTSTCKTIEVIMSEVDGKKDVIGIADDYAADVPEIESNTKMEKLSILDRIMFFKQRWLPDEPVNPRL